MKSLDELLGFVVLTGPLVLIAVWFPLSVWMAVRVSKRFRGGRSRSAAGLLLFVLVFFLPFADEIAGQLYFNYLCNTEAGVKVYRTVELPAEYWDEEGNPKYIMRQRSLGFDEGLLGNKYGRRSELKPYSEALSIQKDSYKLVDLATESTVGETVNFKYSHGWLVRSFGGNGSASGCDRSRVGYFTDVLKRVFTPLDA